MAICGSPRPHAQLELLGGMITNFAHTTNALPSIQPAKYCQANKTLGSPVILTLLALRWHILWPVNFGIISFTETN